MIRINPIFTFLLLTLFFSCEQTLTVDTENIASSVVIDAFIDNHPGTQTINITRSRRFYDNTEFERVSADAVYIEDLTDPAQPDYVFVETISGVYEWTPASSAGSFGMVGHDYQLVVIDGDSEFRAISTLNPVPVIDSIRFNFEEESGFFDERFEAEFFATDLSGFGNTYWIKGFKNGIFLDKPEYITTSYDGGFSASNEDGILFIPPLRTSINPFEEDEQGYDTGDNVRVELLSITEDTFLYLNEIFTQTSRQGGISEIFSVPVTNLNGNIEVLSGNQSVLGFFCTSSVSIAKLTLTEAVAQQAIERAN
ncbi:MAG: DUF4249 family protein [Ekhidna sp.]|nr:DUF4249 family protein [Ekhidna sp.]